MALGKVFAECPTKSTRQRGCCRCTVRRAFFAECKIAFAVCLEHTTKELIPVVSLGNLNFFVKNLPNEEFDFQGNLTFSNKATHL
jgi:hypothetical protein